MFALEDSENVQIVNGHLKNKKRNHHTTLESSLILIHEEDNKVNLIDVGESNKKKRNVCDFKNSYNQINELQNDMYDELSNANNPRKKKKKQKEKANHVSEELFPEYIIKNELIENDLALDTTDNIPRLNTEQSEKLKKKQHKERKVASLQEEVVIKSDKNKQSKLCDAEKACDKLGEIADINNLLKKKKKKQIETIAVAPEDHESVSTLDTEGENIWDEDTGQNESHLFKKKKKKKTDDASELLDQPVIKHIKSEDDNLVKKPKKKKHKERKIASLQEEEEVNKLDTKKQSKLCDAEKSPLNGEISEINKLSKKKKKKQKETIETALQCHESVSTLDSEDENVPDLNTGQSESHVYKKKRKTDCVLEISEDQPVIKQIQNELDEDQVKKRKKKKNKKWEVALVQEVEEEVIRQKKFKVALVQEVEEVIKQKKFKVALVQDMEEEEVIKQKKFKKRKHSTQESFEKSNEQTESADNMYVNDCSDPPLKKVKKHKHKKKVQEICVSDCSPVELNKKKHGENVSLLVDTQLSLCVDNSSSRNKSTEADVKTVTPRKTKKRKHDVEINENMQSGHDVNTYNKKCKKYKTVPLMKEKFGDGDTSAIDHVINADMSTGKESSLSCTKSVYSSPEGNSSIQRNDTARSESVSNDTFTLEIHEEDTHSLDDTVSSSDATEDVLQKPERKIIRNRQIKNCDKFDVNVHKATMKEPLSYEKLLEQVEDKSQLKENSNPTVTSITLPWPIPPLHRIETRVCGGPTEEQRAKMKVLDLEIKSGIFNKNEDDQIKKNWKEFCRLHDLPDEDPTSFLNFTQPNGSIILSTEERINFVRFLAHGLFNRPLASVYKRFQRLFLANKIKTGRFSQEEDEIIRKYMTCTSRRTPYSDLAKILNRDRLAVEKRCKTLECKDDSVRWEKENIEEFLKHMLEITGSDSLSALKNREIKSQEWKSLSKKLGISTTKLQRAWVCTIYPQLFVEEKVSSNSVKVALIKKLIEYNENDWRAVDWERIAKEFDGFTGRKLNKFIKDAVHYHVPQDMQNNLGECLRYLDNLVSQKKIFSRRTLKKININEDLLITQ